MLSRLGLAVVLRLVTVDRQNSDKFNFLKTHIRRKELSKFSAFNSPAQAAITTTASAHDISRGSTYMESMEMSM